MRFGVNIRVPYAYGTLDGVKRLLHQHPATRELLMFVDIHGSETAEDTCTYFVRRAPSVTGLTEAVITQTLRDAKITGLELVG